MLVQLAIVLPLIYWLANSAFKWRQNYLEARASGIPFFLCPVFPFAFLWLFTHRFLQPILLRLPSFLGGNRPWQRVIFADWAWTNKFSLFTELGSDTFIICTPAKNMVIVADADVVTQMTTRRMDFPKPVEIYRILDVYGKNVVTMEGKEWRRHRKITAPQFGEHNNRVVFTESVYQAGEMVRCWARQGQKVGVEEMGVPAIGAAAMPVPSPSLVTVCSGLAGDAMKLSLHVISRAGFDVRCQWPGYVSKKGEEEEEGAMRSDVIPKGHTMSYTNSLETLLHRILLVVIIPGRLLRAIPFKSIRNTSDAFREWGQYMQELYDQKAHLISHELQEKSDVEGLDLMGSMIRGSGQIKGTSNYGKADAGLSPREVIGNAFILFLAGHETAANVIHFCIVYMATRPGLQRRLQRELDDIFGDRQPEDWDYDQDLPKLFDGLTGAIMNEVLRLIPPVIGIPKCTETPQRLEVNGRECTVPSKAFVLLNAAAIHRNPKYWPHGPARSAEKGGPVEPLTNSINDLDEFRPERWLLSEEATRDFKASAKPSKPSSSGTSTPRSDKPDTDLAVNENPDTASTLYTCPKGAYIPFSAGFRACSGRRFAQVEILAALATIFRKNSIELDVGAYADEKILGQAGTAEKRGYWLKARGEVERKLVEEMSTIITIQLRKEPVTLRVCERGGELFAYDE